VASESTAPPPPSGNAKYVILGIALLAATGGLAYCLLTPPPPPPDPIASTGGTDAGTATPIVTDEMYIPDPEPDAGPPPDSGQPEQTPTKRVTHVGGSGGTWECTGDIDAAAARTAIADYAPQIRSCYERRLKANPILQGNLTIQLRVAADGHVDAAQISGSLHDREVYSCIRGITSHMRMPRPTGGSCAVLAQPYSFTPRP
jgi:hypothetical protein